MESPPYLVPHSQEAIIILYADDDLLLVRKPDLVFLDFSANDDNWNGNPRVFASYESLLRRIIRDGGAVCLWNMAFNTTASSDMHWCQNFGHLGTGIPHAIGAQLAVGDSRRVVLISGDSAFQFHISDLEPGDWNVVIHDQTCRVNEGHHEAPSVSLTMKEEHWVGLASGSLNPVMAFMTGMIQASGDRI